MLPKSNNNSALTLIVHFMYYYCIASCKKIKIYHKEVTVLYFEHCYIHLFCLIVWISPLSKRILFLDIKRRVFSFNLLIVLLLLPSPPQWKRPIRNHFVASLRWMGTVAEWRYRKVSQLILGLYVTKETSWHIPRQRGFC